MLNPVNLVSSCNAATTVRKLVDISSMATLFATATCHALLAICK